jgi:hypothetical protein
LTNQFPKLKKNGSVEKKLDAPCETKLNFKQFISKNAAALYFLKLFEFRIVRFAEPVGLIHKAFRQIGAGGFYLKRLCGGAGQGKAYVNFQEHFCF